MMKTELQSVLPDSLSPALEDNCDDTESAAILSERPCAKRKNDEESSEKSLPENLLETAVSEPKRSRIETLKYTDEEQLRVSQIIEQEFNKELQAREEEALLIEERIQRAQRTLHYLCYAVVSDFYSRDKTITQQVTSTRQRRIHPAVKELLAGKHPKDSTQASSSYVVPSKQSHSSFKNPPLLNKLSQTSPKPKKNTPTSNPSVDCSNTAASGSNTSTSASSTSNTMTKVPRYIPPKPKNSPTKSGGPSRGMHNKTKQRIVIGNVSKWLPVESREDSATHKWMVYVRGPKDSPDVSGFVDKVRFFLHPSYRPNDVVQVVQPPFHLSRRGWGEFPVRVQIHFQDPLNKPVDIIHHLKLDRTCTGLQTLGAETIVDVWINRNNNIRTIDQQDVLVLSPVSQELGEIFPKLEKEEDIFSQPPSPPLLYSSGITSTSPEEVSIENSISSTVSESNKSVESVSIKTECDASLTTPISPRRILVSSPAPGHVPSPGVPVSSPSKHIQLRLTSPAGTPSSGQAAIRIVSPAQLNSSPLKQIQPPTATKSPIPIPSTNIRTASPSKVLTPSLVLSSAAGKTSVVAGNSVADTSKALILSRSPIVTQPGSPIRPNLLSPCTNATKLITISTTPNRLTEQSNKTVNILAGTKLVQSTESALPGGGVATSSGHVIKVLSPNKVLQNPNTATGPAVRTAVPKTLVGQNQNVVVRPPGKPISLVKYKAPDGSIRFLQVSQINQLNSKPVLAMSSPQISNPAQNEARPTKLIIRPANEVKPNVLPVPRNSSPLIRLPSPSNVTPRPNQSPVLMFRDGKLYVVRPSPSVPTNQVIRQPTPQAVVSPTPLMNAPRTVVINNVKIPEQTGGTDTQFVSPGAATSGTVPAQVNIVRAVPTAKLMPEAVNQRPRGSQGPQRTGVSLLKSNVLQQSPASSPSVSPVNSPCSSPMPMAAKTISHRVILPRPALSPVSTSTHRTKLYKQMLSTVVRSCPTKSCAGGVGRAIRWMVRNLPLTSTEAKHSEYQVLHPYCAPDTNTFLNWNLGKQRACELMRAQMVRNLLQDVGWDDSEIWTVREILIWARFHGYTIGLPLTDSESGVDASSVEEVCNYQPINAEITEWLNNQENLNLSQSVDIESSDEELDVVSVNLSPSKVRVKQEPLPKTSNCLSDPEENMPLEHPLLGTGAFVNQVLNTIGVQLEPEQIVTGVKYPAAQRVLLQAVQSFIDDIVRRSLAKAWGPNIARSPRNIEVPHVCSAILSRPEFDFLSCSGLGVNSVPSTSAGTLTSKMNSLNPS